MPNAEHHVVGRTGQLVFPDDPFVSPTHADFFYRNGKLVVKDEGSTNGVYLRVKGTVDVQPDDFFLAGRSMPWWAVGLSVMATQIRSIWS